jgi:hypothetical protein
MQGHAARFSAAVGAAKLRFIEVSLRVIAREIRLRHSCFRCLGDVDPRIDGPDLSVTLLL